MKVNQEIASAILALELSLDAIEMGRAVPELTLETVNYARRDLARVSTALADLAEEVKRLQHWAFLWKNCATRWRQAARFVGLLQRAVRKP